MAFFRMRLLAATAVTAALLAACSGEDRPQVDIIGGDGGSASVSVSGIEPAIVPVGPGYKPVSNVDVYFQMGLDLRDIRAVMAPAAQRQPVDWAAARAIYEDGKNQVQASGSLRSLASIANDAVQAMFPGGASVYGRADFINALVRDGLNGAGRGQGASDIARRQIVDKGIQMLMYGKALQELDAARTRVSQGNLDNNTGAPHAVDEAFASIAGAPDSSGDFPNGLLATAQGREEDFAFEGRIRNALEEAFNEALAASQSGDLGAFDRAHTGIKGRLNAIFYLGALRYPTVLQTAGTAAERELHLAEGWTFWQTIRATVAAASPGAAETVEAIYNRGPEEAFPASETAAVYAALNEPAVLQALAIPDELIARTPPTP
ncbi:MAG: hypothetical protein GEU75_01360 [Dehalococcoidia bacterium]|nr:hypothetical protein [Dehalococcoidia bacterium]